MGWRFQLKYANLVGYITVPQRSQPPRVTFWELREFLGSLQGVFEGRARFISSSRDWIDTVLEVARQAEESLRARNMPDEALIDPELTKSVLVDLVQLLSDYELFVLPVCSWDTKDELLAFAEYAAFSSRHHALVLFPDIPPSRATLEVLDPFPGFRAVLEYPERWPGVLFWDRSGASTFVSIREAYRLFQELLDALEKGGAVKLILEEHQRRAVEQASKSILHLSDLHFGSPAAAQNEAYLSARLHEVARSAHRIVITGDLFDNPKARHAYAFRNFRASLARLTGQDVIVIPGNHDQKISGNTFFGFGRSIKQLAELEWTSLVVDDDLGCVFYCFDSSRDADLARGKVTPEQLVQVATEFETKAVAKPKIRDYLQLALVHHHPFSFETKEETVIQRGLSLVGLTDEDFLRMDDADDFLMWCARRNVPIVLHGHKHVQRHVSKEFECATAQGRILRKIAAVGCGTSLGVERMPLSYNLLRWTPSTKQWTISFISDPGDGSGFQDQYIALHSES